MARGVPAVTGAEVPGWRWQKGKWQLWKPRSCQTAWPGRHLKTTGEHGRELKGSPLPQAGNSLLSIWKLATELEAQGIFVTEVPGTEEQTCFQEDSGKGSLSKSLWSPRKAAGTGKDRSGLLERCRDTT